MGVTALEVAALKKRWHGLRQLVLGPQSTDMEKMQRWDSWFEFFAHNYNSPKRVYHTLRHLTELFWHWDRAQDQGLMARPELVALAIWFHDVIYDGVNKQDEDNSAEELERFGLDLGLDPTDTQQVSKWIRQTATHSCTVQEDGGDCCLFMDMDMAILGKPWQEPWAGYDADQDRSGFKEYAMSSIIHEYRTLKGFPRWSTPLFVRTAWCFGRSKFLQNTINQNAFVTEHYNSCLLYTSDAADEEDSVDLCGRRII
eukprot:TRINITY_DN11522_c0_g2_i2.p1 TRINITY_DN11522_c0_g2~~TRINITY_DN11522_c0_g2_i2.p1  ORF type:complete len:256 (-),score=74.22 TRINITY_DN11522_c0_g2_i2:56-823(-)